MHEAVEPQLEDRLEVAEGKKSQLPKNPPKPIPYTPPPSPRPDKDRVKVKP